MPRKKVNSENDRIYLDKKGYDEYLKQIEEIRAKIQKNSSDITEYQSSDAYGDERYMDFKIWRDYIKKLVE